MNVDYCDGCGKKLKNPYRVKIELWRYYITLLNKRIDRCYCYKCFRKFRRLNNV